MSLYADYIKEREDFSIVEDNRGFATFKIIGPECYIRDIYVVPQYRKANVASEMADLIKIIAKEQGCKYLTGSVAPNAKYTTESIQVLLAYGFKLLKSDTNLISFVMEI